MVSSSLDPALSRPTAAAGAPPEPSALELLARIQDLEARVAALESQGQEPVPAALPAPVEGPSEGLGAATLLAMAGRACLVLGGAFLLRALTEGGTLPAQVGAGLGLAYAAAWAWSAHRSAMRGQRPWAAFQVFASAAVAYPLLWETTVRIKSMPPGLASAALLAWTLGLGAVAARHELRRVAWIALLGSLATGYAIMAATSAILALCPFFILASGATLALADRGVWGGLRWPAALGADLAILSMNILALSPGGSETLARDLRPGMVVAASLTFVVTQIGAFLYRTQVKPRAVGVFEVLQTVAVLAVGLLGAVRVAQAAGTGLAAAGAVTLLLGLGCYGGAFAFAEKVTEGSLDFKYLTTLAILLVIPGGALVLRPGALALAFLAAGAAVTYLGVRFVRHSLQFHGLAFLLAASVLSGLLPGVFKAFADPAAPALGSFPAAAWAALAVLAAAHGYPADRRDAAGLSWILRIPSLGFAALALFALGGALVALLGSSLRDPGLLAALRTAVLVALAAASAAAAHWKPASEAAWLAYPFLACSGLKLVLEDLPAGRPATMFLALTLFGAGLLAVPKILARPRA